MISRSKLALCITAFMLVYITFNMAKWKEQNLLFWDCSSYYLYLPATIIYQDLGKLEFYPAIVSKYNLNNGITDYGIKTIEATGRKVNKYTVGTCLFELPFFLLAHLYCQVDTSFPADGYSQPYLMSVVFSQLVWVFLGLLALRKLLLRYFSESATALTLLLIFFATNLYFYTVFHFGMPHQFSFSLVCFMLLATDDLYHYGKTSRIIWIGFLLGIIAITRPSNLVMAAIPLCWPYEGSLGKRIQLWLQNKRALLLTAALFFAMVLIQLSYYKYITGSFLYYSYGQERLYFLYPHVIDGLFSYAKGWFVYTPIALVAFMGFFPLRRSYSKLAWLLLLFMSVNIYIIFCWHEWQYGGSFSARPLIESLPLMALLLAALVTYILRQKMIMKVPVFIVFIFCIALNTFQSYQLSQNVIMWGLTNKAYYWRSFGKLHVTDEDRALLKQR